uniref:Uncharacterized protein n=1 Tax=Anguilla anguilla TaxID=7936 RepID=A0A0E9UI90_ANGAN
MNFKFKLSLNTRTFL